jgi:GDPmannose 4,6-dehydratase
MTTVVALITGVNGQDGSYLTELLLDKGYYVYGILRRTSLINTKRIDHLSKCVRFKTMYGDVTDLSNLMAIINQIIQEHPSYDRFEIYNFAAQSHVKVSFEEPIYTADVDAKGTLNLLEAIRCLNLTQKIRFYQASTSELFGLVQETPQKETTPFYPRSPYGVAKLYSYWIVRNYREAYGIHASNGILFNHESVSAQTPMIYKRSDGTIDIKTISDICRFECGLHLDESRQMYQGGSPTRKVQVWDKDQWTTVKYVSCYPHDRQNNNKSPKIINTDNSVIMATTDHVFLKDDKTEIKCGNVVLGDRLQIASTPKGSRINNLEAKLCFQLGVIVGGGEVAEVDLVIYHSDTTMRVPHQILNSTTENMTEFLRGFQTTHQSLSNLQPVLAQGLFYLMRQTGSDVFLESNDDQTINLVVCAKHGDGVKKIHSCPDYDGWFYDLETESGTFHCGVGLGHVHNSPRRGETFITRKVTIGIAKILADEEQFIHLGNLDAKRDWGHARDYVEGMWLMLQQDKPDDYVLATGHCFSVREFVTKAFQRVGIDLEWSGQGVNEVGKDSKTGRVYVKIAEKYFRPTEVDLLVGDATKANKTLGWTPKTSIDQLITEMVEHDVQEHGVQENLKSTTHI